MSTESRYDVEQTITIKGQHATGSYPLPALLGYSALRPVSVDLVLRPGQGDDEIVWEFSREQLLVGITAPCGTGGDVVVSPGSTTGTVNVALGPQHARTLFTLPTAVVEEFLGSTAAVVSIGGEDLGLDEALARILAEG